MIVKQVTVRVENKEGKLKEVMDILAKENINVEALSIADTVTRLILPNPEQVAEVLRRHKYQVELTDVLRIKIPSKAGALANMLVAFAGEGINLEYMYAFATGSGDEMIIYPSNVEKANRLLEEYMDE
ncbi:MAG: acetolactate synthase [Clostridiales bacterium]|nr:acetolactate synthase [Clostridiales bacterium]